MSNPWCDRFREASRDEIFNRAISYGYQVTGLESLQVEAAVAKLENALESVYFPSDQCVTILQNFTERQREYCKQLYGDVPAFLSKMNQGLASAALPDFSHMSVLTGLAGTGKSALRKAFQRIQPDDNVIDTGPYSGQFPLKSAWSITVNVSASTKDLLTTLAGQDGSPRTLVAACRSQAFRNGISTLFADEFQFATQSSAHARVTKLLLSLGYIGLPTIYLANFSLIHKLVKRPQEDQQRLLSAPVFLFPETRESEGWLGTISLMQNVAPELLTTLHKHADLLHKLTFGVNRNLIKLLLSAYRIARSKGSEIGVNELEAAFRSPQFSIYRRDIDELVKQYVTGQRNSRRTDLWCPIDFPLSNQATLTLALQQDRNNALAEKMLESSMTAAELATHKEIKKQTKKSADKKYGSVVPFNRRKKITDEELAASTISIYSEFQ